MRTGADPMRGARLVTRSVVATAVILLAVGSAGCASAPAAPPDPGEQRGGLPMLSGQEALLLPVQRSQVQRGTADRELLFALESRAGGIDWVGPEELQRLMGRSVMEIPIDRLPIDMFFQSEVTRVGDPVYGMLRRAAALTDATVALIPLSVVRRPAGPDVEAGLESMTTLLDLRTGRVLWLTTVEAEGDPDAPATLARLMDNLARALQPASGGSGVAVPTDTKDHERTMDDA